MSHDKNVHDKKMHDKKSYDKKENEILFKVGDKIKIKGIIKGNQKIAVFDQDKETYEYVIYPRMYISKILENEK